MKVLKPRAGIEMLKSYRIPRVSARVILSANESPFSLPAGVMAEIKERFEETSFNRYPDPLSLKLREEIASYYNLGTDNVVAGNGSDELILYLLLAYGGNQRSLVTFEPTFPMYAITGRVTQTTVKVVPRTNLFEIDREILDQAMKVNPQIVFACSPNNPTGNATAEEIIRELLIQTNGLVVIDEAYAEFSGQSVRPLLEEYSNLVILRTFSKAFSLASLRVGYLLTSPEVVKNVFKVKLPYNYNSFSQTVATLVFRKRDLFLPYVERIIGERKRIFSELKKIPEIRPFPSSANFILFQTGKEASLVWKGLHSRGILVRSFDDEPLLKNCLRVTVGAEEENSYFLEELRKIM